MLCAECKTDFYPTTPNKRFCNVRCRKRFHDRLERERAAGLEVHAPSKRPPLTGERLQEALRDMDRLLDERDGKTPKSEGSASIDYFNLLNNIKKDDEK